MSLVSTKDYPVKPVLSILLQDKTTKKNIVFATNAYEHLGTGFKETNEITPEKVVNMEIVPRVEKELQSQRDRTRAKAEVFTPSWICNKMNNICDEEWFGRPDVFNHEDGEHWSTNREHVEFATDTDWQKYVDSRRIEITCGEAPYIVSRYDTTTGEVIPIVDRIGVLDRKLRVVNENATDKETWLKWTERAFQSVYGFEFQGDNLLLARINLIDTYVEYVQDRWNRKPDTRELRRIANIISWNFWQMDGITDTIPYGVPEPEQQQMSLFDDVIFGSTEQETPVCRIFDWRSKESIKYTDLKKKDY